MIGSDVTLWYEEDMENKNEMIGADSSTGQPPPLYSSLRSLLSTSRPLPIKLYESFVPIMGGMMSATVKQPPSLEKSIIEPKGAKTTYSELDPAESPTEILKIQRTQSGEWKRPHDWTIFSHQRNNLGSSGSFYLTHDQALALIEGPSARKLIIGTAGTGKTIVLQAKAMELLRQGQPVLILASTNALGTYQQLFMENGFTTGYRLEPWQNENDRLFQNLHIANKSPQTSDFARWARDQLLEAAHQAFEDPVQYAFFDQFIRSKEDSLMTAMDEIDRRLRFLIKDCHVFIDDAVDIGDCNEFAAILALLAFGHVECHSGRLDRSIWASLDPTNVQRALDQSQVSKEDFAHRWTGQILPGDLVKPIVEKIMRNFMDQREEDVDDRCAPISVNHLRRIVRATENISQHAYGSIPSTVSMCSAIVKQAPSENSIIEPNNAIRLGSNREMILTREQVTALSGHGPSDSAVKEPFESNGYRRFIVGTAATGKTTVLQAKAMEVMRKKSSVVIFGSHHSLEQYRRIFDANGFVEGQYRFELLSSLIDPLLEDGGAFVHPGNSVRVNMIGVKLWNLIKKKFKDSPVANDELLCLFIALHHDDEIVSDSYVSCTNITDGLANMIKIWDSILCASIGKDAVFIDDTSEIMDCRRVIAIMICMYLELRRDSQRTFWATVDPLTWLWATEDPTKTSAGIHTCVACKEVLGWMTSIIMDTPENWCLRVNWRSPMNIYRSIYNPTIERLLIERLRPYSGLHIQGSVPTYIPIGQFESLFRVLDPLLAAIKPIFDRLANQNVRCDQMGIIYQCATKGPGTNMIAAALRDCRKKIKSTVDNNSVQRVINCADVSSLEFPVAIFVSILPVNFDQRSKDAGRYRASSRCTEELIEINGSYEA